MVAALANPPFQTDDPGVFPVHTGEAYLFSAGSRSAGGLELSAAPGAEVNYSFLSNTFFHLVVPMAYSDPIQGGTVASCSVASGVATCRPRIARPGARFACPAFVDRGPVHYPVGKARQHDRATGRGDCGTQLLVRYPWLSQGGAKPRAILECPALAEGDPPGAR